MYLLSYEDSVELQRIIQRFLLSGRPLLSQRQGGEAVAIRRKLKRIDRGFDPERALPSLTVDVLSLLSGKDSPFDYLNFIRDTRRKSNRVQLEIGRAMVLAQRSFGLLDELSARLTGEVFDRFAPAGSTVTLKLSSSSGARGMSWEEFLQGPLKNHLLPGRGIFPSIGDIAKLTASERSDLKITVRSGKEKIWLKLSIAQDESGLSWHAIGPSRWKEAHRSLVLELNSVLHDYRNRLEWMERYRTARVFPSMSESALRALEKSLTVFYHSELDLTGLSGGVSFGDDPIELKHRERGYAVRCEDCQLPVALEVRCLKVSAGSPAGVDEWTDDNSFGSYLVEYSVRRSLKSHHELSGCPGRLGVSSRTGNRVELDS